jgi:hypothetical protein
MLLLRGEVAQRRKRGEARGQRLMASGARPWRGEGGGVVTGSSQRLGAERVVRRERATLRQRHSSSRRGSRAAPRPRKRGGG